MIYFISEKTIKEYSNIDVNTDTHYLLPAIRESQDIDLQTIIGKYLYKKLQDMVADKTIEEPENECYKEFLGTIKYFLVYNTLANIILVVNYKLNNGGVQQANDEALTSINMSDAKQLKQYYTDKADFYANRIKWFMVDNYDNLSLKDEDVTNLRAQLDNRAPCPIYLGGAQNPTKIRTRKRYPSRGYDKPWQYR